MTAVSSDVGKSATFLIHTPNGYTDTGIGAYYLEKETREIPKKYAHGAEKTQSAYILHEANTKTPGIDKIISSRRLVVLDIKDGELQCILMHPNYKFTKNVEKFIISAFNPKENKRGTLLIHNTNKVRLMTRNEYKILAERFL